MWGRKRPGYSGSVGSQRMAAKQSPPRRRVTRRAVIADDESLGNQRLYCSTAWEAGTRRGDAENRVRWVAGGDRPARTCPQAELLRGRGGTAAGHVQRIAAATGVRR